MTGIQPLAMPLKVNVVDGKCMVSSHFVPNYQWYYRGVTFNTDFKLLPLDGYDMILGMDCLESNNPMSIHWEEKWMKFGYKGREVQLQGVIRNLKVCNLFAEHQLRGLVKQEAVEHILELKMVTEEECL